MNVTADAALWRVHYLLEHCAPAVRVRVTRKLHATGQWREHGDVDACPGNDDDDAAAASLRQQRLRNALYAGLDQFVVPAGQRWLREAQCPICLDALCPDANDEDGNDNGCAAVAGRCYVCIKPGAPAHSAQCPMTMGRGGCHFDCFAGLLAMSLPKRAADAVPAAFCCPMCRAAVQTMQVAKVLPTQ